MTNRMLHVVFTPAAAGDLRKALGEAGRAGRVVCAFEDFSFGPINPPDASARQRWVEDELGYTGWDDVIAQTDAFWRESLSAHDRKLAWFSRRSAQEYAGFLEWLWRLGDSPCEIVDLTDVTVLDQNDKPAAPHLAVSLALLHSHQILKSHLLDRAAPLTPSARDRARELWHRLRIENAPLRVLATGSLASAPISHFDQLLLSFATPDWQKVAMIVGKALASFCTDWLIQTGDLVMAARIRALAHAGLLESQGDLSDLHQSRVRLAAGS